MRQSDMDLTQGPMTAQLVSFALPLLLGALIQQLYSTVDMMFVGRELGTSSAAAVGSSGMLVNCIVGFFTGLSVGVGVVVGKTVGAKDKNKLCRVIHCAAALALMMSFGLLVMGEALAVKLLQWMDTPEAILPLAVRYLRVYLLSLPSIVCYSIGTGILKALGNSKTPTLYQLIGGLCNVLGNYLLIVVLRLGVVGAALTTMLSQTLAAVLTVRHLFRLPEGYCLRAGEIRLEGRLAREILSVGIPAAVQVIMISLSNVFVQASINRLDEVSIAVFSAYYKVENIIYYPIMAVGQACSAFVSQNVGAGNIRRAQSGTHKSLVLGLAVTLGLSALVIWGTEFAFSLFSKDAVVIAIGSRIARIAYPFYFLYVFLEIFSSAIRGSGNAMPAMVITIVNMCFVRLAVLTAMEHYLPGVNGIAAVYPITWACTAACMGGYYCKKRWVPQELRSAMG